MPGERLKILIVWAVERVETTGVEQPVEGQGLRNTTWPSAGSSVVQLISALNWPTLVTEMAVAVRPVGTEGGVVSVLPETRIRSAISVVNLGTDKVWFPPLGAKVCNIFPVAGSTHWPDIPEAGIFKVTVAPESVVEWLV